jgi:hypothetical protein
MCSPSLYRCVDVSAQTGTSSSNSDSTTVDLIFSNAVIVKMCLRERERDNSKRAKDDTLPNRSNDDVMIVSA